MRVCVCVEVCVCVVWAVCVVRRTIPRWEGEDRHIHIRVQWTDTGEE